MDFIFYLSLYATYVTCVILTIIANHFNVYIVLYNMTYVMLHMSICP